MPSSITLGCLRLNLSSEITLHGYSRFALFEIERTKRIFVARLQSIKTPCRNLSAIDKYTITPPFRWSAHRFRQTTGIICTVYENWTNRFQTRIVQKKSLLRATNAYRRERGGALPEYGDFLSKYLR